MEEQFNAFVGGFNELIPSDHVNVFDERELELLIGGIADIDVDDWKKHTDYRGYTETDEVITNFWKVSKNSDSTVLSTMLTEHLVHPELGCRAEITSSAIRYWHLAHSCQWLQGPSR